MKTFNNTAGTTSSDFALGQGTGSEVRQIVLNATGPGLAHNRDGYEIVISSVEFYDIKMLARNASGGIVSKQLRGTIHGVIVTRIEDVFQEDFAADVTLTSNGTILSVHCTGTANFTIYTTLTRVA